MAIPVTQVRTSHALSIKAGGSTVGLINSWNPAQSRTLTPIYEVGADDSGNLKEYMPGNITGLTININRYDIYNKRMEEAFGTTDLIMLTRQTQPFDLYEIWAIPSKNQESSEIGLARSQVGGGVIRTNITPFTEKELYIYQKCWFTSLGRTLRSDDNRIVNVNATIVYTKKLAGQGILGELAQAVSDFSLPSIF
ncbi:hypothetical protein LCGC14_2709640 [marine sediment metagenome]|uniref:Uncharacterized protein n=1 Tax=marine sediment metagenome TaxID=412755 RepID=A0A0F8ZD88_9ZZZZ